ncbi:MAG: lipoyl(octanoyl) transferase [Frankiales bacterium]|jgi:lipoyl(octanoyl) transferase|nr:lipoyl(octanoyl) transferase [Frankiales bacterium]
MPDLLLVRAGRVPYQQAWDWQRALHSRRVEGDIADTVLLVEHEPVYTAGKRTNSWERPTDGSEVIDVDRGGRITWHGPGQLTGYPIVAVPTLTPTGGERPGQVDVVGYVRRLEEALIRTCADLGVATVRVEGRSGVWVEQDDHEGGRPQRKVAAIGVRVARGIAMHGFALNADCSLEAFHRIVPCGLLDAGVTTLSAETGRNITVDDVLPLVEGHLAEVLGATGPQQVPLSALGLEHVLV